TSLVEKLCQRFSDELYCMEQRLTRLFQDVQFDMGSVPFGPENLCLAFQGLLESMDLDLEMRLYHFKRLDKVLMKTAGDHFLDINALLIAEGILPELKRKVVKHEEHATAVYANNTFHSAQEGESGARGQDFHQPLPTHPDTQMYQAIQQLLAMGTMPPSQGLRQGSSTGGDGLFSITPRLLDSLTQIQEGQVHVQGEGLVGRPSLKEQVNAVMVVNDQGGGLNQIDNDTIDVISMIFDLILDDRSLSDSVKALIGRLQIPILKAAIIDRNFFKHKSHPARQLINKLAYAGVGWSEDCEATQDRLYKKMESIISRILEDFENDMQIFEDLLTEFEAFIGHEREAFEEAQEKIRQESLAREQRERMKRQIVEMIMEKNKVDPVPDEILEFLVTTWSRVVIEASQAHEGSGPGHERSVQFIEDLMWSLAPKKTQEERKNLLRVLPGILKLMREGLEWVGYDAEEIQALFTTLEQYHVALLKGTVAENRSGEGRDSAADPGQRVSAKAEQKAIDREIELLNSEIDSLPDLDGGAYELFNEMERQDTRDDEGRFEDMMAEMGLMQEDDPGPRVDDEFTDQVRNLELGSWVELSDEHGKRMRVKLAWRGDQFTNFSFVNRHYKVVAERPFYVLADEFRKGKAIQVDAPELFDRALDGVISGIMRVVS
ncbi:MAG TPA: DUF1631 domain-containing protein, partial [Gammaproteobacteria bacterium]|nr:DUF1631 domain-containing protein [Gammaproteobacteria bacterium]